MDGYDKKKYIYKLVYIIILGYDIGPCVAGAAIVQLLALLSTDIGHMEALQLLSSNKYSEKSAVCCVCI